MISILISSHNRIRLLENALLALQNNPPDGDFEVVIADEGSTEPILDMLRQFKFPITFVEVDMDEFTANTGIEKYHNNPALTNNIAFAHCEGDLIFLQGNDIVAVDDAYNKMLSAAAELNTKYWMMYCTTYNGPEESQHDINAVLEYVRLKQAVLQSKNKQGDITNYLSLCPRSLWEELNGYDERYVGGQACEDSDFARRARKLAGPHHYCDAETIHQFHGSVTNEIGHNSRLYEGLLRNRKLFNNWHGGIQTGQYWKPAEYGVGRVVKL